MDDLSGIRVLVVDDNAAWRDLVTALLRERSVNVIGTAGDGVEAVEKASMLRPNVVIMDIWMPRLNGLAATRDICTFAAAARVVIVSNESDRAIVDAAFAAGARGYVPKSLAGRDLLDAIKAVARGETFVSADGIS